MKALVWLLLGSLGVPTAAFAQARLDVAVLTAPEVELPAFSAIAVAEFAGYKPREMEGFLKSALSDPARRVGKESSHHGFATVGPDHFRLVEREKLASVLSEIDLGQSGLVSEADRRRLGDLTGAALLLTGKVSRPEKTEEYTTYEYVEDDVKKTGHCFRRQVEVEVLARVIDIQTGEIIHAPTESGMRSDSHCDPNKSTALSGTKSVDHLAGRVMRRLGYRLANEVSPAWQRVVVPLAGGRSTREGLQIMRRENDVMKAGRWMIAHSEKETYDDALQYNAAVFLAFARQFERSREKLNSARAIKDTPMYRNFGEQLNQLEANNSRLAAMGIPVEPLKMVSERAKQRLTAEKVQVKGGPGRREPVYAEPGSGGIVVQVPGRMNLVVLERQVGWVKVRTFDGKEGWIDESRVK